MLLLLSASDNIKDFDFRRGAKLSVVAGADGYRLSYNYNAFGNDFKYTHLKSLDGFVFYDTETRVKCDGSEVECRIRNYILYNSCLYLYCVPNPLLKVLETCINSNTVYNFLKYFWHGCDFIVVNDGVEFNHNLVRCRVNNITSLCSLLLKMRLLYGVLSV